MRRYHINLIFVILSLTLTGFTVRPLEQFPSEADQNVSGSILTKPQGDGPFPAIVMLHTCGGVGYHLNRWRRLLDEAGYVVLLVDSFTPRGAGVVCDNWNVSVDEVAADALAAAAHLRKLPFVDGSRIGVVGFSYGAMAGLRLASEGYVKRQKYPVPFRAVVAFYPYCTVTRSTMMAVQDNFYRDIVTPVHLLLGGADTEAPASLCTSHADSLKTKGQPVSYTVFPGATHAFDMTFPKKGYSFDAEAVKQSWEEMREFLAKQLK